ncbi:uncharacterized protein LOC143459897 isoform X2 [Clavelina lepadiformis]|uniref:uncharacterized protein LOC143459897 isoform X2 n=1 Tax=Clavelina lepadiformis TaxID=159417 RepID=UPI0040413057
MYPLKSRRMVSLLVIVTCLAHHCFGQEEEAGEGEEPPPKPPCGEEHYKPEGEITSPGYPGNYPNDQSCVYRILTDKMINVYFETFAIEESEDCTYDFLNVVFNATAPGSEPQRLCGEGLDKVNGGHLRGGGPLITAFVSDEAETRGGFKFTFEFELNGPDPCESDPCQNGGECQRYAEYYACECSDGYVGVNCEKDIDECASYPCDNGGECIDDVNQFFCQCINSFTGELCEIAPDRCSPEPCDNGGLCIDRGRDFVCSCPRDFMGDRCETPIPTLPPPTTIPTTTTTTTTTTTKTADPQTKDDEDNEDKSVPDENSDLPLEDSGSNLSDDAATDAPTDPENLQNSDGNSFTTLIIILAILFALLLIGGLLWYWWKYCRKKENEKPNREVTLVNMNTKSESGEGKEGRRLSRTTSINSITMTRNPGNGDQFLDKLKKMSEDIIMEEVTDVSLKETKTAKPHNHLTGNKNLQVENPSFNSGPTQIVNHELPKRQVLDPYSQRDMNQMNLNRALQPDFTNSDDRRQPEVKLSPDEAIDLLNKMKENKDPNFDFRSALDQYGLSAFQNKVDPISLSQQVVTKFSSPPPPPEYAPPANLYSQNLPQNPNSYQLPHVPVPSKTSEIENPYPDALPPEVDDDKSMELNSREAADLVNYLMSKPSRRRTGVNSKEAMDIMRDMKGKRPIGGKRPTFEREKSIMIKPHEIAHFVNNVRNFSKYQESENSLLEEEQSSSVPSESMRKHPQRVNRNFREYTPIREESDANEDIRPNQHNYIPKISSKDMISESELEEPMINSVHKRTKQIPYASTLDPDEKVNVWLASTPNQKGHKYKPPASPGESTGTATHTITRPLPRNQRDNPENVSSQQENLAVGRTARTIKQTRKLPSTTQPVLPVTENKAKSLVEKLIQAPARSNKNVVGPGLSVARQNAFVGDHHDFDNF